MKKHANGKVPDATEPARALDPSEIAVVLPGGFTQLDPDFAPTRPVSELPSPPESRDPDPSPDATVAVPKHRAGKTADIAPDLLPSPQFPPSDGKAVKRASGRGWLIWGALALAGLAVGGGVAYWLLRPVATDEAGPAQAAEEPVPPELRAYMAQAKAGDAKAMHMIALMYWNGLNIRQDRAKGLIWYHKAAEAGSTAARETLKTIEGQ